MNALAGLVWLVVVGWVAVGAASQSPAPSPLLLESLRCASLTAALIRPERYASRKQGRRRTRCQIWAGGHPMRVCHKGARKDP